jgi:para-aminobenzoate synthetase component 1
MPYRALRESPKRRSEAIAARMRCCAIIEADWAEPAAVLAGFADEPYAAALLSGGGGDRARCSYLARQPDAVLTLMPGDPADAFAALRAVLGEPHPADPFGPPFQGGLIGLIGYEFAARTEPVALGVQPGWPDLACARYPAVLAFDHQRQRCMAVGRGADAAAAKDAARRALDWRTVAATPEVRGPLAESFDAATPSADYETSVADVIARIGDGEIFQANIARAWTGRLIAGARPFDLLRRLIARSPAPFAGYLRLADRAVVSNSPERFLQVRAGPDGFVVETRPIKGTRPRGADAASDAALAAELLASAKDRAENLMIVDLMRNDLSRVCAPVNTRELFRIESFANVHHLVSTIEGRLRPGLGAVDVLRAAFPPGSITGAPKVQAMKVIAGLEPPRGPYCGSLFWAGFDGALDSSVLIRTAALVQDEAGWSIEARAGAGIVADSDPVAEARETEDKIAAIAGALMGAAP